MNDGKCDAAGRFWAGTMAFDVSPGAGSLYCLVPGQTPQRVLSGCTISNGLGWSPDGTTMYYIDTPRSRVDAFDFDVDAGEITARRTVVSFAAGDGWPDGMTVDVDGCLWVAMYNGGSVRRF